MKIGIHAMERTLENHDSTPRPIGLVLYGFGRVGRAALELALTRPWIEPRGVIAGSPSNDGLLVSSIVAGAPPGLRISTDADTTLRLARPDVVILATNSTLKDVMPQLDRAAASGAAVICTAEELAYLEPADGPEQAAIHELARRHSVPIVAVGVNPGFVLDLWPLVASGMAWDVPGIEARRIVDGSVFGPRIRASLGIGFTAAGFTEGVAQGSIVGHLGFRESLRSIAAAMGRPIEEVRIETEPIMTEAAVSGPDFIIEAGRSAGTLQRAVATIGGEPWITMDFIVHVAPETAGLRTIDELRIRGRHPIHVIVEGGYKAVLGTAALLVNSIPRALAAPIGVHGVGDIPFSVPWLAHQPPPIRQRNPMS